MRIGYSFKFQRLPAEARKHTKSSVVQQSWIAAIAQIRMAQNPMVSYKVASDYRRRDQMHLQKTGWQKVRNLPGIRLQIGVTLALLAAPGWAQEIRHNPLRPVVASPVSPNAND